jgi:hypothetical protein
VADTPASVDSSARTVPPGGAPAWSVPDPTAAPVARLDPGLRVQLLEQRPEGWAYVRCSNGWSAWVDGRTLLADAGASRQTGRPNPPASLVGPVTPGPVSLVGAAVAVIGSFLPWFSFGAFHATAWDISIVALLRGYGTNSGLKAGAVILLVALAALPLATRRPLSGPAVLAVAGLADGIALLAWLQNRWGDLHAELGIGLLMTFAGGSAIIVDVLMTRKSRAAP